MFSWRFLGSPQFLICMFVVLAIVGLVQCASWVQ